MFGNCKLNRKNKFNSYYQYEDVEFLIVRSKYNINETIEKIFFFVSFEVGSYESQLKKTYAIF